MNPILEKIEQGITEKVTPENKSAYMRTIIAGEKIMFDEKTHANMELVKNPNSRTDPVTTISSGIAGLMWMMYMQSQKKMPAEVLILAGVTLMTKAFDFAERGLGIMIDNKMIADATKKLAENLFVKLGINPDQLTQQIMKGKAEIEAHQSGINLGQDNPAPVDLGAMQGAV